jgi:hypothetical protein
MNTDLADIHAKLSVIVTNLNDLSSATAMDRIHINARCDGLAALVAGLMIRVAALTAGDAQ